ncbi:hypothetical protein CXF86_11350 [Shewanella sp. GutCb]|uniref:hypothetical protein n=1 Tax=Shewanella sp. GutCb TaxID=2058315 RepID=UPI000C7C3F3E|nr:hypothetical protein [Shewanella sp. GutCb]PKG74625.1 hypothetical protein CXF86_11350 [Shewanella sp. GutCb]
MSKKHGAADNNFKGMVKQYIEAQSLSQDGLARMEALLAADSSTLAADTPSLAQPATLTDAQLTEYNRAQCSEVPGEISTGASAGKIPNKKSRSISKMVYAMVASLLLLVAGYQLSSSVELRRYLHSGSPAIAARDMSWKIADEVARNHVKMKPLEVQTQNLNQLREYFTQLDFTLVNSSLLDNSASKMLGGRYCSIQGLTAAQIRFKQDNGAPVTLYEVQYDPSLYGELPVLEQGQQPIEQVVRGVEVSIWIEKGLLMATARSVD